MVKYSVPPGHGGGVRSSETPLAPSVSVFQLTERSRFNVPAVWKNGKNFTITRLQSPFGLSQRIVKTSAVKALLVSVSLRSIPLGGYQLWADAKRLPMSYVPAFRSNVIETPARRTSAAVLRLPRVDIRLEEWSGD